MTIPPEFGLEAGQFPPLLRALLDAELAAGNSIAEVGHTFPAPPAGAFIRMTHPITTRPRESGGGLQFRAFNSYTFSGSFTDDGAQYFILEPPLPPPPEPDMDAIRAARASPPPLPPASAPVPTGTSSAVERFESSMVMNYEKWHDGIGYDLDILRAATETERQAIQALLLRRGINDWRDAEALAFLDTPPAHQALRAALHHRDPEIRLAVTRYAPNLVSETDRSASLVKALESATFGGGLSQALDEAAEFHPKEVVQALLRGALRRHGDGAVHFAALLMFLHGQAEDPFDWNQRPFFLRFHAEDRLAREAAFLDLCAKIGVNPEEFL